MRIAAWVLVLAACGDNAKPSPDAGDSSLLKFTPCYSGRFECATLVVPADWSVPDGATLSIPVVRAPATVPALRIGAITFNFGGPGGSTQQPLMQGYPHSPIATSVQLEEYFDFVLVDWRGVATTSPVLTCFTPDTKSRMANERFAPQSSADWTAMFQLMDDVAAGCRANASDAPLLAHQDSESAARDVDALRAGIGEDKLNMWVVSYGTRLGSMYATLFPDHVRAIVLDSPMAPVPDFQQFLMQQSVSFDAEFTRFFAWCAAATDATCPFRTPDGMASSVSAKYEQLLTTADTSPVVSGGITLDRWTIDFSTTTMMYSPAFTWAPLGKALAHLSTGDGTAMAQLWLNATGFTQDDNSFTSYQNVMAQDVPIPSSLANAASYQTFAESVGAAAPHVGLQNANLQAFAIAWPATIPSVHAITQTTAPPLLITATRHDPATPYAWAGQLQQTFANGSYLVTYEGDGHANGSIEPCLGEISAQFLLDPTTAPAMTDCPEVVPTARATGYSSSLPVPTRTKVIPLLARPPR